MAKVQGTFYTAERLRRGTSPISPPYAGDEGQPYPVNPPGSGNAPLTPPVAKTYASEAAMIADQASQLQGYLYFDGTANWWYKGTVVGDITDYQAFGSGSGSAPVAATYANQAAMIAAQGSQVTNYFYFDSVRYWEYLGTTAGTIADYRKAVFGVSPYDLAQEGAADGQVVAWVAANSRFEPVTPSGGSSLWTLSGSDIYRSSLVTIGQSTIIDADLGIFQSAPTPTTPALRLNGVPTSASRRDIFNVYTNTTRRHWLDNYGIPTWKLYNGLSEAGALTYTTPAGGLFGILTATDENFTATERAGITWNPAVTLGSSSACTIFTRNTTRINISATGTMAFGGATLSGSESYRFRNISGATIIAQFVNAAFSANSLICYEDLRVYVDRIVTSNFTGTTARVWKLGERKSATTALDTTQYLTVEVNGTIYNIALVTI